VTVCVDANDLLRLLGLGHFRGRLFYHSGGR
jgi:hypothetical protein